MLSALGAVCRGRQIYMCLLTKARHCERFCAMAFYCGLSYKSENQNFMVNRFT